MKPNNVDYSKLPESVTKLLQDVEQNSAAKEVEQTLGSLMKEVQDLKTQMSPTMRLQLDDLEASLQPLLETMRFIADKQDPEQPDFSQPVVEAVQELEKTLGGVIRGIDISPKVNVAAPNVKVDAPQVDVDLSGVERAVKQIAPALEKAIKQIPTVDIPEQDNSDIVEKLNTMLEWLESIDHASRLKPQIQNTLKVTNPDGSLIGAGGGGSSTQYAELITTAPATGNAILARYKATAPVLTDGQLYTPQLDASGNLKIIRTDTLPSTVNITAQDVSSSSVVAANGQNIVTGTPTTNSSASFVLNAHSTIRAQATGTWTGTLSSEISIDGGTTWVALGLHQGAYTTSTFTANFVGGASISGATNYRIRASATWTGTATIRVTESANEQSVYLANAAPAGNVNSLLNSSTATLLSGAVFTGTAEDVSNFSEMRITVISNVASATNGFVVQQSSDGTNWDVVDSYTTTAGLPTSIVVPRQARFFRVVYTNGGTNQSSFRLWTILNRTATSGSSQRSQDAYSNENDLEQVWSFNSVWNGSTWDRAPGDLTGARVKQRADNATLSNVSASASSVTLLSANTARIGATITNDSSSLIYIKFGTTASTTSYTVVLAGAASAPFSYYEVPAGYTGRIDAIWSSATGNARVTEIS